MTSILNLSAILELVDRASAPMRSISTQADRLSRAFSQTQSQIRQLSSSQQLINSFRAREQALRQTQNEFARASQRLSQFRQQMQNTSTPTQTLTNNLRRAERETERLRTRLQSQSETLRQTGERMNRLGINTRDLASEEARLGRQMEQTNRTLAERRARMQRVAHIQERLGRHRQIGGDVQMAATKAALAAGAAVTVPVKAAIDFETSMADVKKVVDFGDDPTVAAAGLAKMSNEILKLSTTYPMAAKDIASIVAAGGQSGIANNELTAFASDAIKMGVAFDITADQAGQAMAEMRTAFRMNQEEVMTLANQINHLGNNTPAAATGIMEIVQRIGPLGEVGGFASGSIAALGATMRGMGIAEEIAATGIKNLMLSLVAGEGATKKQMVAFKELGLNHEKVAKDMQADAEGTVLKVLEAVSKLDKHKQAAMLQTLFGKESLGAIAPLLTNMEALRNNLAMVADKTKFAGSVDAEYAARAATTANTLQLLKNAGEALAIVMGNALLPTINTVATKIADFASRLQEWAAANPKTAETIMKVVAVFAILSAVVAVVATAFLMIIGPIALLQTSLVTLSGGSLIMNIVSGFGKIAGAVRALGLVLMTNPILAIIAVIAAAAFYVWSHWDTLGPKFAALWSSITAGARQLWSSLTATWESIKASITAKAQAIWASLGQLFWAGVNTLKNIILTFTPLGLFIRIFAPVFSYLGSLRSQFSVSGGQMMEGLKAGIMKRANAVIEGITSIGAKIKSAFTSVMSIHSPSRVFAGYGDNIMQGLNNGLVANQSPIAAVTALAHDMQNAFDPHLGGVVVGTPKPMIATGQTAGATPTAQHITINVYGAQGQSEETIARLVAQKLGEANSTKNNALFDYAEEWG